MEKVIVDKNICIGCGFCAANCDEIFKMDDDDLATTNDNTVDNMNEELKDNVLDIKEGCPVGAIKIEEKRD